MSDLEPEQPIEPGGREARNAFRVRSFLRGEIYIGSSGMKTECTIRDISETGARIQVSGAISIPDQFELFIPQRNRREKARMIWRNGEEAGLVFVAQAANAENKATTPVAAPDMTQRVQSLEDEIARLRSQLATMRAMVEHVFKERA
jgi:hypothetical protein